MSGSFSRMVEVAKVLSRLPPWLTVPGGVVTYVACHHFSLVPVGVVGTGAPAAGDAAAMAIVRALAVVFQFLLPFCFAMASAMWTADFVQRRRLKRMADRAADADVLAGLSWEQFETVAAQGFVSIGFDAQLTGEGADGGFDIVLKREGRVFLVQAKHWRDRSVGVDVVRALYGVLQAEGADGAYVVTSGQFTRAAAEFAAGKPLWLYSGKRLRDLLSEGRGRDAAGHLERDRLKLPPPADAVTCPLCEGRMILREAKRGKFSGKRFYGCAQYPACSGLRAVD